MDCDSALERDFVLLTLFDDPAVTEQSLQFSEQFYELAKTDNRIGSAGFLAVPNTHYKG